MSLSVPVPTIYLLSSRGSEQKQTSAGILEQFMGARNQVGIGLSCQPARARIFKLSIPPDYVTWRAGTTTLSYLVPSPHRLFKNSSSDQSLNFKGAQESIPRNLFSQPMKPDGPARQIGLSYRLHRQAESIPGLLKSLQIRAHQPSGRKMGK